MYFGRPLMKLFLNNTQFNKEQKHKQYELTNISEKKPRNN